MIGEMEKSALKVDEVFQDIVNKMGDSAGLGAGIRENITKAVGQVRLLNLDFKDVQKTASDVLATYGRNVTLSEKEYTNLLATQEVTGVKTDKLLQGFADAGMSVKDITKEMDTVLNVSNAIGVNAKLVSAKVVENLDKLNKFGFQNGIEGLAKMAAKAQVLRIDMKEIFTLADTLMDPEGAIELASTLQRLGTTSAALTDPLRLMDMAQNDVGALTDELGKMFSQYAEFSEENQRFEILPGARLEIRELEKDLRLPAGTIEKMAIGTKDLEKKLSEISFSGFDIPQDAQELIANMSMMGESGEYMIKYVDEEGKSREATTAQFLDDFGDDVEGLKAALGKQKEIEGESIEQKMFRKAEEQLTVLQSIAANTLAATGSLGLSMGGGEFGKQFLDTQKEASKITNQAIVNNLGPKGPIFDNYQNLAGSTKDAFDVLTGKKEGDKKAAGLEVAAQSLAAISTTLGQVFQTGKDIAKGSAKAIGIDLGEIPGIGDLTKDETFTKLQTQIQTLTKEGVDFLTQKFNALGVNTDGLMGRFSAMIAGFSATSPGSTTTPQTSTTPRTSTTVTPVGATTPTNPTAAAPQITVTPTPATSIVTPPATATLSPTTIIEITQLQEILSKNIESENNNTTIISALNESLTTFNTANTENQTNVLNQLSEILTTNNTSVITLLNESLTTLNNTNTANQTNQTNILTQFSEIINKNITSEENNTNSINTLSSILVSLISITKGGIVEVGEKGSLINNFNTTQLPTDITAIEGTEKGGTVSPNNESLITYTQLISAIQELSTKIGEISSGVTTLNTGGFDMSKMMVGPAEAGLEGVMSDLSQFEPINRVLSNIVSTTQVTDKGISNEENVNNVNQNQTLQDILIRNITSEDNNTISINTLNNTLASLNNPITSVTTNNKENNIQTTETEATGINLTEVKAAAQEGNINPSVTTAVLSDEQYSKFNDLSLAIRDAVDVMKIFVSNIERDTKIPQEQKQEKVETFVKDYQETMLLPLISQMSSLINIGGTSVTNLMGKGGFNPSQMLVGPESTSLTGGISDVSQFKPIEQVLKKGEAQPNTVTETNTSESVTNNLNQIQLFNNSIMSLVREATTNLTKIINFTDLQNTQVEGETTAATASAATPISVTPIANNNQPTINVTEPSPNTDTTSIQPVVTTTPVMGGSFPELLKKPEEIKKEKSFNLTEVVPVLKLISENNTNNNQEISNNFDTAVKTLITDNNQNSQSLITTVNSQNNFPDLLRKPEENKPERQFDVNDFTKVLRPTVDLKSEATKKENNLSSELASIKKPDVTESARERALSISKKLSMLDEDKRLFTPIPETTVKPNVNVNVEGGETIAKADLPKSETGEPKEGETGIKTKEIETLTNTNETLQNFEKVITESNFGNEVPLSVAEFKGAEQMISQFANPEAVPAYATPPVEEIQKKSEDIKKVMTGSNNVNTDNINMDIKITGADTPEFNKFKDDLEQKIYAEVKRRTDDRIRTDSQFQRSINANTSDVNFGLLTSEIQSV
jgi:hypothetical protein